MNRKRLSKSERKKIYESLNGHCAYCGCKLKIGAMHVDHKEPLANGGSDTLCNMLPACRSCNHRKGSSSVESFRGQVEKFVAVLERDSVTYKNAVRFGLVIPNPHKVKFYFEKTKKQRKAYNSFKSAKKQ